jgi:hypothetical protein
MHLARSRRRTGGAGMSELIQRVAAAQASLDAWRDKPFKLGKVDCVRFVAFHLRRMGHQVKLPPAGSYGSLLTASRRLAERGHADLPAALDAMGLERIAPAAAWPGDVIALPADSPIGALAVALSNGRVAGFHEDTAGVTVLQPMEFVAAWRVPVGGSGANG